jgi:regulator of protease activity HflC (stomatin/prohibitin superfamily)
MTGLEKLVDFLFGWIRLFKFWVVVDQYERGLLYRLGKSKRVLEPGLHWHWPFAVDEVFTDNTVLGAILVDVRTPTKDGVEIAAVVSLGWTIEDIEKFLNEIEGAEETLGNLLGPSLRRVLAGLDWGEIPGNDDLENLLLAKVRARKPGRWGVAIRSAELKEIGKVRTFRIIGDAKVTTEE